MRRPVEGPMMQPRESAPLWVGLTFALLIVGSIIYVTGYFMIEDLLTFFK
jgi:flagellar biogenesis protein FliO